MFSTQKNSLVGKNASDAEAEKQSQEYREKLKNAVLLCVNKMKLLEDTVPCYRPSETNVTRDTCKGRELYGHDSVLDWNIVEQSSYYLLLGSRRTKSAHSGYEVGINGFSQIFPKQL